MTPKKGEVRAGGGSLQYPEIPLVVLGQREFAGLLEDVPSFDRKMRAGTAHRLREADFRAVQ